MRPSLPGQRPTLNRATILRRIDRRRPGLFRGIKESIPDADDRTPQEVLSYVAEAVRAHGAVTVEGEKCTDVATMLPETGSTRDFDRIISDFNS